jgi:hypothetical protein
MSKTKHAPAETDTDEHDLVWGAPAIARVIGKSLRSTYHLLESQYLPVSKVGTQWVGSRRRLLSIGDPQG